MNDLSMGEVYETKTNYKKYIQDLRDQYPFDPLSVLITESFANSMDAGATQIDIYVDEESYKIKDNGKGMTKYEFIEYHNIASLTKEKGKGGIGFAGIGAKTYLDLANHIYTETKSKSFYGASKWRFDGEVPRWEVVYPKGLIKETGTFIEVKLNTNDVGKITEEFVKKTLQEHYNAVLLGLYKVKEVRVNGKLAKPWKPEQIEEHSEFKFKISGHEVNGFFIKASDEIPEEFQGVSIVVYGKTVNRNEWFRQFTLYNEKIMGMMIADYLISIVNTSKTQFIKTSSLWRKFYLEASLRFSQWLDNIGAKFNPPKISSDTDIMVRRLEKSINEVLNTPELSDLANTLFQNKLERTTVIKSVDGQLAGVEVEGSQKVSGTLGNSTT
ncbi:MAG: ATP-binding protein, partial [Thermoproteota archaeon]